MNYLPIKVAGGKLVYNPLNFARFASKNEGKWCHLKVLPRERSLSQLRMYRAWLHELSAHTGDDEEALHEWLLKELAPRIVLKLNGTEREVNKRTSGNSALTMTKEEMSEYMEKAAIKTEFPLPTKEQLEAMGYIAS